MRTRTNLLLVATAASLTINSSSIYSAGDDSSQYTVQRRTTIDESRRSIGLNEARVGEGRSRRRRRSTRRRDEDHYQSSLSKRRSLEEANSEFYDLDSLSEDEKRRLVEVTVAIMDSASIDWDGLEENFINTVISDRSRRSQQTRRSLHSGDTEKHEKDDESDNIVQQNKRAEQRFKLRQQQLRQQHHQRGRGRGRGRGKGKGGKSSKGKSSKSHSSKSSKSHSSKSSTSKSHSKSCGSHSKSGKGSNDCPESVTASPTTSPSQEPSYQPTPAGTASNAGTPQPTLSPTPQPTPTPTPAPTAVPTQPQPGLPETQLPSQLPTQPPTPFNNTNWFNYTYDEGNCPNAGTFGVPCYNNTKGRISEICDKYNRDFGSFRSCMDACAPSFCCIHDALPPPEDGPSTGTNFIAPHCNLDENCPQYTYCYIVWWKLHDTIGPALYLRLSQDDQFFDIEEEDIQEDQTGSELFTQVLLHHFDDVAQVISAGTVDGEFSAKNIFDDSTWWESTV